MSARATSPALCAAAFAAALTCCGLLTDERPAGAATAPAGQSAALREVVFDVSYARSVGGAETTGSRDHGTVTVDVMAVRNNALGVKITQRWTRNPTALVALGTIEPAGQLDFAPGALSDAAVQLLPFFAPLFAPQTLGSVGVAWTVTEHRPPLDARTRYAVTGIQGMAVTIKIVQSISISDATHARISASGAVVYEPHLLVPLSGDITRKLTATVGTPAKTITLQLHFARSSDTREP
ncbi:MAG TPA: hypothetical protein VKT51_07550 [Candidatus Eremiobacteraceae bacterium]|nr:hypothetical protein [Candidatus Eremiobacteraceae bacterium]